MKVITFFEEVECALSYLVSQIAYIVAKYMLGSGIPGNKWQPM
jgi:hypothetical protein